MSEQTFTRDNLLAGDAALITGHGTLLSGENRARGTVLGKITLGAASSAAKTGGNTGNGTLTLDGTTPILAKAKAGVYKFRITRAIVVDADIDTQAAQGTLTDPDGFVVWMGDVPTTPGVTVQSHLKFVVLDGVTPFIVGDGFDVTIAAGSGKLKIVNSANVDGSQYPHSVLAAAVDASLGDKACMLYHAGEFAEAALVFGGSDVVATHRDALRALGIHTKATAIV